MKRRVVSALMVGLFVMWAAPAGAQDPAATRALHMMTSGSVADMGWADALSSVFFEVFTETNGVGTNALSGTLVSHREIAYDPTSQVCTDDPLLGSFCHYTRVTILFADAIIDPDDFRVTANTARLRTDLSRALEPIFFNNCVIDEVAGTTVCNDVPPSGLIDLEWRRTTEFSFRQIGTTQSTTGPETFKLAGTISQFSAIVNGSSLGQVVTDRPGDIGTSHSVAIDIFFTTH